MIVSRKIDIIGTINSVAYTSQDFHDEKQTERNFRPIPEIYKYVYRKSKSKKGLTNAESSPYSK